MTRRTDSHGHEGTGLTNFISKSRLRFIVPFFAFVILHKTITTYSRQKVGILDIFFFTCLLTVRMFSILSVRTKQSCLRTAAMSYTAKVVYLAAMFSGMLLPATVLKPLYMRGWLFHCVASVSSMSEQMQLTLVGCTALGLALNTMIAVICQAYPRSPLTASYSLYTELVVSILTSAVLPAILAKLAMWNRQSATSAQKGPRSPQPHKHMPTSMEEIAPSPATPCKTSRCAEIEEDDTCYLGSPGASSTIATCNTAPDDCFSPSQEHVRDKVKGGADVHCEPCHVAANTGCVRLYDSEFGPCCIPTDFQRMIDKKYQPCELSSSLQVCHMCTVAL